MKRTLSLLSLILLAGAAQSQGVASAEVRFHSELRYGPAWTQWPAEYTFVSRLFEESGFALSETNHGALSVQSFLRTGRRFSARSSSVGDSEQSSNCVVYDVRRLFAPDGISINNAETYSSSQAAAESTGESHFTHAVSSTSLLHRFSFSRFENHLTDKPKFWMAIQAAAGAVSLKTKVEGNADAFAEVKLSFIGTITNDLSENPTPVALPPIVLATRRIEGNAAWSSPEISGLLALDLPNYTRLGRAHFGISMGLQVQMITYARANPVPEPSTLVMAVVGIGLAVGTRFRRKH